MTWLVAVPSMQARAHSCRMWGSRSGAASWTASRCGRPCPTAKVYKGFQRLLLVCYSAQLGGITCIHASMHAKVASRGLRLAQGMHALLHNTKASHLASHLEISVI